MMKTLDELKSMPIWMLWKKRARGERVSKIPVAADGRSCGTSGNYADRWVTFEEAQQAVESQRADGIGFRIPNGVFFLDIDHRDLQEPFVQELLEKFHSYSEYSVSGQGNLNISKEALQYEFARNSGRATPEPRPAIQAPATGEADLTAGSREPMAARTAGKGHGKGR